ncbi:biopolymer transport protein ExbD [Bradyrhizobium japonicum]
MIGTLDGLSDMSKDKYVFLRADRSVPYGELMSVMELLRSGGYSRVKLVALEGAPGAPAAGAGQP